MTEIISNRVDTIPRRLDLMKLHNTARLMRLRAASVFEFDTLFIPDNRLWTHLIWWKSSCATFLSWHYFKESETIVQIHSYKPHHFRSRFFDLEEIVERLHILLTFNLARVVSALCLSAMVVWWCRLPQLVVDCHDHFIQALDWGMSSVTVRDRVMQI